MLFEAPAVVSDALAWDQLPTLRVDTTDGQFAWLSNITADDPKERLSELKQAPTITPEIQLARARAALQAGWDRADSVATASVAEPVVTSGGLPVRRPGNRLVPGGVTKAASSTTRDPEAIRARLQAHAAGVSRGRTAAATTTTEPQQTEAGPA